MVGHVVYFWLGDSAESLRTRQLSGNSSDIHFHDDLF